MKRVLSMTLVILLILSLFILSGCSLFMKNTEPQIVQTYPMDVAPSQVIKTETQWVLVLNTYGKTNYKIVAGENPDSTNEIYSVDSASIWYVDANEKGIVWCEKSSEFFTYKVYLFESNKVETISQELIEIGYQPQNIGIFQNTVYYCKVDYEQREVCILAYDTELKSASIFYKTTLDQEKQPYSINLENEYLSLVCSDCVKVFHLQKNEIVFEAKLPSDVIYAYTASYDSQNDTCAVYYADNNSEDIVLLKKGDTKITSIFTFSEHCYAYQEKIRCYDGHIYWITQSNVSGMVTDHYRLVDYNYLSHTVTETDKTFSFYYKDDVLYFLRFNKRGEYTHVNLCRY